jgi:hypothetical protein
VQDGRGSEGGLSPCGTTSSSHSQSSHGVTHEMLRTVSYNARLIFVASHCWRSLLPVATE